MRWSGQLISGNTDAGDAEGADPGSGVVQAGLFAASDTVVRTFDTPGFRGATFYEVRAKSVLNKVPGASPMFGWTINPYRGCGHRCVYCFARQTHTYLDFDAGLDFDTRIVVKVNAPEVVRRELARPSWRHESVAMGTNVDCYQRAEGRYRLMPGIIGALAESGTPFSILTKGTLMLRDLPLLEAAARDVPVNLAMSIGSIDESVWRTVEAGTPSPARRLDAVRTLADAGLGCSVLMAPILPFLTDSPEQLRQTVAAIADAGARSVTPIVLHLRSGAREWYYEWLRATYPRLVPRYRALYRNGSYAPSWYQDRITSAVREYAKAYGLVRPKASGDGESDGEGGRQGGSFRNTAKPTAPAVEIQPALWDDEEVSPS